MYHAGKILISTDPLALDTTAASMLGMEVEDIPILESARDRQLGESDLDKIEIAGDYDSAPLLGNFKHPRRFHSSKKGNHAVLVKLIDFLKARPRINLKLCKDCNMCVESCPVQAIDQESKRIDYSSCIECMCCHELCLHKAVELRRDNWAADILIRLYRGKYQ